MITTRKSAIDTYVREDRATTNFGQKAYIALRGSGAGTEDRTLVAWDRPFSIGALVVNGKLRVWTTGPLTAGPYTIDARRVTQKWIESGAGSATWATRPTVGTTVASVTTAATLAANEMVEIDVTAILAEVAAGNPFYGFELRINAGAGTVTFWSGESADSTMFPELETEWSVAPSAPTDLVPSGGKIISVNKPVLDWKFVDSKGEAQTKFQVQASTVADFSTTVYDSGWLTSEESALDLSTTGFGGFSNDVTYYWRVRVQDNYGMESPWSAVQSFMRKPKPTVTITSPGAVAEETTPPITHTFTPGHVGQTQVAVRYYVDVLEVGETTWVNLYDSGWRGTTATTFMMPEDLVDSLVDQYRVNVFVLDSDDRVSLANDKRYTQATQVFTWVRSATPAPVTNLVITTRKNGEVLLEWQRATQPDFFAVRVDGKLVTGRIDSADALVSSPDYAWQIHTGYTLFREHEFEVEAIVLDGGEYKHSEGNDTALATPRASNVWIKCPSKGLLTVVLVPEATDARIGESAEVFFPIGRRDVVRIVDAIRGHEGTVTGRMGPYVDPEGTQRDAFYWRDQLEKIKGWQGREKIYMNLADRIFEIELGEIADPPDVKLDSVWFNISVQFWQKNQFTIAQR